MKEPTVQVKFGADNSGAMKSINELSMAISGPLSDAVKSTLSNLEGAFLNFARTGELNVRDMVNAIIADLSRIAFETFVQAPLQNLFSGLSKGLTSSLTSMFSGGGKALAGGQALGGSVGFGRPYVVGEQGRELFVPETSGRIVPNNTLGGSSIVFNVQATDAASFQRSETQIAAMLNRMVSRGNRNL